MIHKITLTDTELQSLVGLLDAGVRATGLRSVKDAAILLSRIEGAEQIEDATITPEATDHGNAHD